MVAAGGRSGALPGVRRAVDVLERFAAFRLVPFLPRRVSQCAHRRPVGRSGEHRRERAVGLVCFHAADAEL